jgi:integrase
VVAAFLDSDAARGGLDVDQFALLPESDFNRYLWWPALTAAGVPQDRQNGMHALRHFYASVLLDGGESIKALAAYLGHADPGFTLRTYTHLMPTGEERTPGRSILSSAKIRWPHGLATA